MSKTTKARVKFKVMKMSSNIVGTGMTNINTMMAKRNGTIKSP
jgi:hypothetical protein